MTDFEAQRSARECRDEGREADIDTPAIIIPIVLVPARTLHFSNQSDAPIDLIIEPIADRYELAAGESLMLSYDEAEGAPSIEVGYHGTGDVSIWTHTITQAFQGDVLVLPV